MQPPPKGLAWGLLSAAITSSKPPSTRTDSRCDDGPSRQINKWTGSSGTIVFSCPHRPVWAVEQGVGGGTLWTCGAPGGGFGKGIVMPCHAPALYDAVICRPKPS